MIAELEGMDRGWYAGPVGWMDAAEDGEFCVALRSALLRDRTAHLYAGAGSSPAPTRRPSWPRPRSSSKRCCRCWRAERQQRAWPRWRRQFGRSYPAETSAAAAPPQPRGARGCPRARLGVEDAGVAASAVLDSGA